MRTNRQLWTPEEDRILADLVLRYEESKWTQVSETFSDHFPNSPKTAKQCRERWINYVDPNINKSCWSEEEKKKVYELHQTYGNKWATIAKKMKGRTENSVKNYFYSDQRKELRRKKKEFELKPKENHEKNEKIQKKNEISQEENEKVDENIEKLFDGYCESQEHRNLWLKCNPCCPIYKNHVKMEDYLVTPDNQIIIFFNQGLQNGMISSDFKESSYQYPYYPFF